MTWEGHMTWHGNDMRYSNISSSCPVLHVSTKPVGFRSEMPPRYGVKSFFDHICGCGCLIWIPMHAHDAIHGASSFHIHQTTLLSRLFQKVVFSQAMVSTKLRLTGSDLRVVCAWFFFQLMCCNKSQAGIRYHSGTIANLDKNCTKCRIHNFAKEQGIRWFEIRERISARAWPVNGLGPVWLFRDIWTNWQYMGWQSQWLLLPCRCLRDYMQLELINFAGATWWDILSHSGKPLSSWRFGCNML